MSAVRDISFRDSAVYHSSIYKISSYRTENTQRLHYEDQLVSAQFWNINPLKPCCLFPPVLVSVRLTTL